MKAAVSVLTYVLVSLLVIAETQPALAAPFRVTGVVLSQRDGAPVPYCRISASPSAARRQSGISPGGPVGDFGRIRLRSGGLPTPPVPGTVRRGNNTPSSNPLQTRADAEGRFSLDLPHAGRWRVVAETRGFRAQAYDSHEEFSSSIALTDASPVFNAIFRLVPDSMIGGLVIDEAGDPVAHAQVIAERIAPPLPGQPRTLENEASRQTAFAQTDDLGRYELANLAAGVYRLHVLAQPWYASGSRGIRGVTPQASTVPPLDPSLDLVFPATWYPAAITEDAAETITLTGGEDRQADFHLTAIPAAHLLIAHAPDSDANTAGGRRPMQPVSITRVASDGIFGQTSFFSGAGNQWDFGNLAPGTYEVRVPGTSSSESGEVRQVEVRPGSTLVSLDNSRPLTRVSVTFDGNGGAAVPFVEFTDVETGRRIVANAGIRLREGRDPENDDAESRQMNVMLPPHRYAVVIAASNGAYLAGMNATGARVQGHTIEIGETPATVTLHLAEGRGEITGTATLAGHQDVGAMVLLVPVTLGQPGDRSVIVRDQTNTDGSFELSSVIPGRYILVVIDHGWNTNWRTMDGLVKYLAQGTPVEVRPSVTQKLEINALLP